MWKTITFIKFCNTIDILFYHDIDICCPLRSPLFSTLPGQQILRKPIETTSTPWWTIVLRGSVGTACDSWISMGFTWDLPVHGMFMGFLMGL
jgi:hypothetical protein